MPPLTRTIGYLIIRLTDAQGARKTSLSSIGSTIAGFVGMSSVLIVRLLRMSLIMVRSSFLTGMISGD